MHAQSRECIIVGQSVDGQRKAQIHAVQGNPQIAQIYTLCQTYIQWVPILLQPSVRGVKSAWGHEQT